MIGTLIIGNRIRMYHLSRFIRHFVSFNQDVISTLKLLLLFAKENLYEIAYNKL